MAAFDEQAVLLGPANSLVGVITHPAATACRPGTPLFVILNAGIIHRIGPNRMSVALARALARDGFRTLRFDLSGLGDSEPRKDDLPLLEATMADITSVLDSMSSSDPALRVVLLGLCSGADHSVIYAASDRRVVGVVLLDPSIPRTPGYYLRHYGRRLVKVRPWLRVIRSGQSWWRSLLSTLQTGEDAQVPLVDRPEVRQFLQNAYKAALTQGVKMLVVFTGGLVHRHNDSRQLLEAFHLKPFGQQLRLEYFGESDHTFTTQASQTRLQALVIEWSRSTGFTPMSDAR